MSDCQDLNKKDCPRGANRDGLPRVGLSSLFTRLAVERLVKPIHPRIWLTPIARPRGDAYEYRPYWIALVAEGAALDTRPRYTPVTEYT